MISFTAFLFQFLYRLLFRDDVESLKNIATYQLPYPLFNWIIFFFVG